MSAYQEFEKVLFDFGVKASESGGQEAMNRVEYGHVFHFEDKDAIRALKENASKLSQSSLERLKGNLDETIIAGVRDGKPIAAIKQDVAGIFERMKDSETERIARTEVARGVNEGALLGYDDMGVSVVEYYANAGACPLCEIHHGELMDMATAHGFIPVHPNCYCFWLPRPDITARNVKGWRSVGEIPGDILSGLGVKLAYRRVSMAPQTFAKIAEKSPGHLQEYERARVAVELANAGTIDTAGHLNLIREIRSDKWEYVPIKYTEDRGLIALSGHEIKTRQLTQKLGRAVKTYGI